MRLLDLPGPCLANLCDIGCYTVARPGSLVDFAVEVTVSRVLNALPCPVLSYAVVESFEPGRESSETTPRSQVYPEKRHRVLCAIS